MCLSVCNQVKQGKHTIEGMSARKGAVSSGITFTFDVSLTCDLSRCARTHGVEVNLPTLAILHFTALPHTSLPHTLTTLQVMHA